MIILTLTGKTILENLEQIEQCKEYIQGLELRVDLLDESERENIYDFPSKVNFPVILTVRKVQDGGKFAGDLSQLLGFYKKALNSGFNYFDFDDTIDEVEFFDLAIAKGIKIIYSFHDFKTMPKDFVERTRNNYKNNNFIPKAAVTVNSSKDLYNFYKYCEELKDIPEKIVLAMGAYGFSTRVLTRLTGSLITYTSFNMSNKLLGHIGPDELFNKYRYTEIDETTTICGIIGNPIMHSASPQIHNSWYVEEGLDYVYLPFQVDNVGDFLKLAKFLKIKGLSVTLPHKTEIIKHLDEVDDAVRQIGSCNTVAFDYAGDGTCRSRGYNTDWFGFIAPLAKLLGAGEENIKKDFLFEKTVCVIGAGGASRSIIYALLKFGAEVKLYNRSLDNAKIIANDFCIPAFSLDDLEKAETYDIIVQTSSAGMGELIDNDPSKGYKFSGKELAYDIIYTPIKTKFLERAEKNGALILNGYDMLVEQAKLQHKYFTNNIK